MAAPSQVSVKASYDIDLTADTSHTRVIRLVGQGQRVLEVGCATGYLGRVLTERFACTVTGIEVDAEAAAEARQVLARVIEGDVEAMDLGAELADARFDVILCADVLEHLRAPARVLGALRRYLAPGGCVVASIPNVAHAAVIAELLIGRFSYRPLGLLDEGHLRFFTRDSINEMFEHAGFEIEHLERLTVEPAATELGASFSALPPELAALVVLHEESRTYQFVLRARPALYGSRQEDAPPGRQLVRSSGEEGARARFEAQVESVIARAREAGPRGITLSAQMLREEADGLYRILAERDKQISALTRYVTAQQATLGWKALERFRRYRDPILRVPVLSHLYLTARRAVEVLMEGGVKDVVAKIRHKAGLALEGRDFLVRLPEQIPLDLQGQYDLWLSRNGLESDRLAAMRAAVPGLRETPLISLLAVMRESEETLVERTLGALRAQAYPRWELCLVLVGSDDAMVARVRTAAAGDARVRVVGAASVVEAYGAGLTAMVGEFVGVVDAGDELAPEALFEMVSRLNEDPCLDVLYSEEDALDGERRVMPFFKPDWSPDLLLSTNFLARLGLVRRKVVDEAGGFRSDFERGQPYDLMLRVTERTTRIAHVPKVLYHRRLAVPSAEAAGIQRATIEMEKRALRAALQRRELEGQVEAIPSTQDSPRHYAVRLRMTGNPLVSIIIPTRDKWQLLARCIHSIREKTSYERYEIIVVDNDSRESDTLAYFASLDGNCRVLRWPGTFNFSKINNFAVSQAQGEQLLFLNNDVEVTRPDWLTAMLEHAQRSEVGAVGAKLLYPDGRIQHGGVVVGINRAAAHAYRLWPGEAPSPRLADVVRNWSAVTAACMMVPRRVFEEVGGFDERLRVVFNDVDLCLKIRERGYLVVYTPFALLYHYEGASRGRLHPTPDERLFQEIWSDFLDRGDPYYNPNLTSTRDDWSLRL